MISNIILEVLRKVSDLLNKENLEYCLFGGLAMQVYKRIRATKDIDLMLSIQTKEISKIVDKMQKTGFLFDKTKEILTINKFKLLRFIYQDKVTGLEIFIDFAIADTDFQKQLMKRKITVDFLGINTNVASLEDIILLKLLASKPIDKLDAQYLVENNFDDIDKNYLKTLAKKLNVIKKLENFLKN